MKRRALLVALAASLLAGGLLTSASSVLAEQHGTREQAQAMVAKAIALYDEKGKAAFEVMDQGAASGFRQEDLYIFVIGTGPDARVVAHGLDRQRIGAVVAALTDSRGNAYGKQLLEGATPEGAWVNYDRVNPESGKEEPKSSWVVLHDGYIFGCGVYIGP
jgi:Signal transduction histidine kinase